VTFWLLAALTLLGAITVASGVLAGWLDKPKWATPRKVLIGIGALILSGAVISASIMWLDKAQVSSPRSPDHATPTVSAPSGTEQTSSAGAESSPTPRGAQSPGVLNGGGWKASGPPAKMTVRLSPDDPFPQGAIYISPFKLGSDYWKGDVSVECRTPDKGRKLKNCLLKDARQYFIEAVNNDAEIAAAAGNSLIDFRACLEESGIGYQTSYVDIQVNGFYCLRKSGQPDRVVGIQIIELPNEQPRPRSVVLQAVVWTR
jgi:hypothetical protein